MQTAFDTGGPSRMTSTGLLDKVARRLARRLHRRPGLLRNPAPMVTFTFDDVPRSACLEGRRRLEQFGVHGTFYVCGGLTAAQGDEPMHTRADLVSLLRDGHEIGCHGFGHVDYQAVDIERVREDLDHNRRFLLDLGLPADGLSFAYPFGCISPRVKREVAARYASARGVVGGPQVGEVDLGVLASVPLYSAALDTAQVSAMVEHNARVGGWLIFFTHGVEPDPRSHGCEPALLDHAVRSALDTGSRVLPMREALAQVVEPLAA